MVDPIATAAVGAVGELSKSAGGLLNKWLGPVAEESAQNLVKRYRRRVERIAQRGEKKTNLESPGAVPLRVAAAVFEKAQWSDDEFVAEYLSGVLASGRSNDGENDAGVSWAALVGRMSADQLRLHYVLYSGVRARVIADGLHTLWDWTTRHFVVDVEGLFDSLDWPLKEDAHLHRLYEAAYGLEREDCLTEMSHGDGDYLSRVVSYTKGRAFDAQRAFFVFRVTATGIKLFLNGHGYGQKWYSAIEDSDLEFTSHFDAGTTSAATVSFVDSVPRVAQTPTVQDISASTP
ncbi:hypothetical protein [Microbacterium sp. W4I20]|uniref:hypothetical protein n=1 Tax=Microbacterium sp. W4I20 TaxID=3042262 RepID=UPI00277D7349|nr:hypothetical protein [Microbacterium sp. W4I20]MDQ0725698.1 hypothetical protein [Microbacterium sp. W4I20]